MVFIDQRTAVLCDKSIINFNDDGTVEFFGSDYWKKSIKNNSLNTKYSSKKEAIEIWSEVENKLKIDKSKFDKKSIKKIQHAINR